MPSEPELVLGKFFLIRTKSDPALVVEIKDGVDQPHASVVLGEVVGACFGEATASAYQLWYIDSITSTIRSKLNEFCLDIEDDTIIVNPYSAEKLTQNWVMIEGDQRVRNKHEVHRVIGYSSRCIGSANGAQLCSTSFSQTSFCQSWTFDYQPPVYFYIKQYDDTRLVLDIQGAEARKGAKVIVYRNKGELANNQLWYEDQMGVIRSKLNNFAIDASSRSLITSPIDRSNRRQQWIVNGSWIVNKVNPNEVLQFKRGNVLCSATVVPVEKKSGSPNVAALWKFEFIPGQVSSLNHSGCGKFFVLRNRYTGLVLEARGEIIEPGSHFIFAPSQCKIIIASKTKDLALVTRQEFYMDDITGTFRNALRNHCVDIVDGCVVLAPFDPRRTSQQWRIAGKMIQNRQQLDQVLQINPQIEDITCPNPNNLQRISERLGNGDTASNGINESMPIGNGVSSADAKDVSMSAIGYEIGSFVGSRDTVTVGVYTGSEWQHWETVHTLARCFYIVSKMNEKVLDVRKDEASSGAVVIMYDRKVTPSFNQLWYEDEHCILRSKLNGYVLDSSGDVVRLRPYDETNRHQQWTIAGDRIQNHSNPQIVLDIFHKNSMNGANLIEFKYHGKTNQRWKFVYAL